MAVNRGDREIAQWLNTWAALPKDPELISSKCTWQFKIISDYSFIHAHSGVLGLFIPAPSQPPPFSQPTKLTKTDREQQRQAIGLATTQT